MDAGGVKKGKGCRVRVLIADDSRAIGLRLVEMLSEVEGVETIGPALDGEEALRLFWQFHPDAAVVDIQMPKRNGLEVLVMMRQVEWQCLILVLTNHCADEFRDRCLGAGADHFLQKSADFERVPEIIKELLQDQS